jgi:alpha-L-fucosidase
MRYAILTTKHHDGFCLFDSGVSDYTSARTAARRDLVREYVEACRRHDMRVGLYYSLADWHVPAYFSGPERDPRGFARFIEYTHGQVEELCTNYGSIDLLWFDGGWPHSAADWQSERLDRTIRRLQPHVMINDRLHGGGGGNVAPVGDYAQKTRGYFRTAEQRPPGSVPADRPVETERTSVHFWWGYMAGDRLWKSPREVVYLLTAAAESGANFVLNVGPRADGSFPGPFRRTLEQLGGWMDRHGDAVYGSAAGVLDCTTLGHMTVKGDTAYLHVLYWPGRRLHLYGLANKVACARLLADGRNLPVVQKGLHVYVEDLPPRPPDPYASVIALKVDGRPAADPSVVRLWSEGAQVSHLADWADG